MPVSGWMSVTLSYKDISFIDELKKEGESRADTVREALKELEIVRLHGDMGKN